MESRRITYISKAGVIVSLFCFVLLSSCSSNEKVVAQVGDSQLLESEAHILMKHLGYSLTDKTIYKSFLQDWCENEALKAEMKNEYPEDWDLIRLRSESFAGDLARFYLEEIELKKQLDTIVSMKEIQSYYESHKDEFVLHDYIVKALYLKIPKELDFRKDNIHLHFLLKNDKDLAEINSYAKLYAENYYFNDSTWRYFEELTKDFPVTQYNIDNIVLNRSKTYFSDDDFTYFLNIIDFKLKDEAPPVDFLKGRIREIIVSNRLHELKQKNESKLIQSIKKKHEIIINI